MAPLTVATYDNDLNHVIEAAAKHKNRENWNNAFACYSCGPYDWCWYFNILPFEIFPKI